MNYKTVYKLNASSTCSISIKVVIDKVVMFYKNKLVFSLLLVEALCMFGANSQTYDAGCQAEKTRKDLSLAQYFLEVFKSCSSGGLWQKVQCDNKLGCYCVFVNTGQPIIPNSYATRKEIQQFCPVVTSGRSSDVCKDPPVDYPCSPRSKKYYFNQNTRNCEEVSGQSCFGFNSLKECKRNCNKVDKACGQPLEIGIPCDVRSRSGLRYWFNKSTKSCTPFYFLGCSGNENNFKQKWECEKQCAKPGNSTIKLQMISSKQIVSFTMPSWLVTKKNLRDGDEITKEIYGSLQNDDRVSINDMNPQQQDRMGNLVTIDWKDSERIENCKLPSKTGMCRAYFLRWYYDFNGGSCKQFVYGGCQANANNFRTQSDCREYCVNVIKPKSFSINIEQNSSKFPSMDNVNEIIWKFE